MKKKIEKLSKKKQEKIRLAYESRKLKNWSAWALWLFGLHYLHTNRVWLWFVYLGVGLLGIYVRPWFSLISLLWRIVQAFMLKDQINKKNWEILKMIYTENA